MFYLIIILALSHFTYGEELEFLPIENYAPQVKFDRTDRDGNVHYKFKETGILMDLVEREKSMESENKDILEALVSSQESESWESLDTTREE